MSDTIKQKEISETGILKKSFETLKTAPEGVKAEIKTWADNKYKELETKIDGKNLTFREYFGSLEVTKEEIGIFQLYGKLNGTYNKKVDGIIGSGTMAMIHTIDAQKKEKKAQSNNSEKLVQIDNATGNSNDGGANDITQSIIKRIGDTVSDKEKTFDKYNPIIDKESGLEYKEIINEIKTSNNISCLGSINDGANIQYGLELKNGKNVLIMKDGNNITFGIKGTHEIVNVDSADVIEIKGKLEKLFNAYEDKKNITREIGNINDLPLDRQKNITNGIDDLGEFKKVQFQEFKDLTNKMDRGNLNDLNEAKGQFSNLISKMKDNLGKIEVNSSINDTEIKAFRKIVRDYESIITNSEKIFNKILNDVNNEVSKCKETGNHDKAIKLGDFFENNSKYINDMITIGKENIRFKRRQIGDNFNKDELGIFN